MKSKSWIGVVGALFAMIVPAHADMNALIFGAKPTVPSTLVLKPRPGATGASTKAVWSTPRQTRRLIVSAHVDMSALIVGAKPTVPSIFVLKPRPDSRPITPIQAIWVAPLVDRVLTATDRASELSSDLREVILRIEGMYDPTRLDGTGQIPRMSVRAGTASMNNVFADRWIVVDPDPNVDYAERNIANAWHWTGVRDCPAFVKRHFVYGTILRTALSRGDCTRLKQMMSSRDDQTRHFYVVAAPLDVPVFAAPAPGARLSSRDFWMAQEARIETIKAALRLKRQLGFSIPTLN